MIGRKGAEEVRPSGGSGNKLEIERSTYKAGKLSKGKGGRGWRAMRERERERERQNIVF